MAGYDNYSSNQNDLDYDPYAGTGLLSQDMNDSQSYETGTVQLSGDRPTANLEMLRGELIRLNTRERYMISEGESYVLGRSEMSARIVIGGNPSVSNRHAEIICRGGRCMLGDLLSTNGTFVNDRRLLPGNQAILNDGEYVTLGNEIFQFWQH